MEPENPVIPTPPLPKKNNLVVILLSIFLFITLLISGYLFLQVQSFTKQLVQLQVQPTPTPLSTEASAQEGTTNWKTYSNTTYKFSFKYPDTWKYNEDVGIYFGDTAIIDNSHYRIALSFDNKDYLTLKNTFNTPSDNSSVVNINGKEGLTHSIISLVLKKDYKLPSSFTGDVIPPDAYESKVTAYEALVPLGSKTLRIYSLIETKEIIDKILSTFKFTN